MSLIVEDGTGLSNAESYISVADADAYHAAMGNAAWTGSDAVKEAALRRGTQYLDASYNFRGNALFTEQSLQWPRDFADWPVRAVREACCELALRALAGPLHTDAQPSAVTSETVGPLSVTYAEPRNSGQVKFAVVQALLRRLITSGSVVRLERVS